MGRPGTGTAIGGGGGAEARDGGLMLALVLNRGVIAGGAQAAASVATGGKGTRAAGSRLVASIDDVVSPAEAEPACFC